MPRSEFSPGGSHIRSGRPSVAPFDESSYIIFSSAHSSGLLPDGAYEISLIEISLSFVVSPVLIELGYKLADRFPAGPRPELSLKGLTESIHDYVVVVGYSYVGRVICMMLELASIPYIAFEVELDRLAVAKKERHKVYYGDVTDPSMIDGLAIARARAVIVTMRDYSAVKLITGTLRQFHPNVKVMTAVPYLYQRDELQKMGAEQVVALTPEGTLSFGRSVLGGLGVRLDDTETIVSSLRAEDYASMRSVGGAIRENAPKDTAAEKG